MTTANLLIYYQETNEVKNYNIYHDGYQVALMLRDIKSFEFNELDKQLKEKGFNFVPSYKAQREDWAYTLTINNKNEAMLLGAGTGQIWTEKLYTENKQKEMQKQENTQKPINKPIKKKGVTP